MPKRIIGYSLAPVSSQELDLANPTSVRFDEARLLLQRTSTLIGIGKALGVPEKDRELNWRTTLGSVVERRLTNPVEGAIGCGVFSFGRHLTAVPRRLVFK